MPAAPAATAFEPIAVESRYRPPKGAIHRDRSGGWMRRALPIVAAHKAMFVTALAMSAAGLVLTTLIPLLLDKAITNSIVHHTVPLHFYVWWVIGLGVAAGVTGYISRLFLFETAYRIEFDLRNIIYEHLTRLSFSFYDRVQSGQLISRANSDIRSVQMYLTFAPSILVQCGIAVVAFVFMLTIDVPLALLAMATMPFVVVLGIRMRKVMFPVSWLIQARLAEVATIVDENVNGVRVVKSFAAEPQQLRALARTADRLQWSYVKDADLRARYGPLVQNLPQLGLAFVLLYGGYLIIHGHLHVGTIVAFNLWLLMLQAPFMMLGMIVMMGQRAAASAQRIYEILDEEPAVVDRPGAVDLRECRGDVRFERVTFCYGGAHGDGTNGGADDRARGNDTGAGDGGSETADAAGGSDTGAEGGSGFGPPVLDGFDLHVRPGETVALVGRTGSGKSTAARLLARFYDVDAGVVRIDGHDVRDLTLASLRANVSTVVDEAFLFSVSIRDNIAYGRPTATMDEVVAAAAAAGADEFIRELPDGYATVVGERGYTLSGGQRQRIAIARTLLVNPPVLVLDDATSAVDVQVEQEIHAALRTLLADRTTLVVAHRLSTISLADRVALLEGGRVVAVGTHAELLATTPLYAEVLAQVEPVPDDAGALQEPAELAAGGGPDWAGSDGDGRMAVG